MSQYKLYTQFLLILLFFPWTPDMVHYSQESQQADRVYQKLDTLGSDLSCLPLLPEPAGSLEYQIKLFVHLRQGWETFSVFPEGFTDLDKNESWNTESKFAQRWWWNY